MKLVFFGTPEFAVPTLEALHESTHDVLCVVTSPDKKSGRGLKLQSPSIKRKAEKPISTFCLAFSLPKYSDKISVHKNVEANKTVPKAIGSEKKENLTNFNTCIFAVIIAITV